MSQDTSLFSGEERTVEVNGNGRIDWRKYNVKVDLGKMSECAKCGAQVWWARTGGGKKLPIEYSSKRGGYVSHYDNC